MQKWDISDCTRGSGESASGLLYSEHISEKTATNKQTNKLVRPPTSGERRDAVTYGSCATAGEDKQPVSPPTPRYIILPWRSSFLRWRDREGTRLAVNLLEFILLINAPKRGLHSGPPTAGPLLSSHMYVYLYLNQSLHQAGPVAPSWRFDYSYGTEST